MRQRRNAANGPRLARPGMSDAQMERIIKSCADLAIRIDHQQRIDRFGTDDHIVKILLAENIQVFLELGDHDGQKMPVLLR